MRLASASCTFVAAGFALEAIVRVEEASCARAKNLNTKNLN